MFLLQSASPETTTETTTVYQDVRLDPAQLEAIDARIGAMQHDVVLLVCFVILLVAAMALMQALGRG